MRVVVVGAGEVGTHVAQLLSREGSDVTVIESNADRISQIDKFLDVSVVHGSATDLEVRASLDHSANSFWMRRCSTA